MLALLVLGAALAAAPASGEATTMEAQAGRHVVREFERVGRRAPVEDTALGAAARRLAREALTEYTTGAPDLFTLTEAVSDAEATDPSPRTLVIRAWAHDHAIGTFLARKDFNQERASHFGVGVAFQGERAALVLLLSDRKAELQPFPRTLARDKGPRPLCGRLVPPLRQPEVYVTRPDGEVDVIPSSRTTANANGGFCARVTLSTPGTYTLEVVGRADGGPEVAALFLTQVGAPRERGERKQDVEPTTLAEGRRAIGERIRALRRAHQAPDLAEDATLTQVAQAYAERMAAEGFFAHIAPDGSTLTQRMPPDARYVRAGENLGMAEGPLAAHFGIEHSPGHRRNLLDPGFRFMGVGIAFQQVDGRPQAIVTEVFSAASPSTPAPEDPQREAYDALSRLRAAHKLPPLERSEALEGIALAHARRALQRDEPASQAGETPLHERVFSVLPDAGTAAVDFFVLSDPAALPESRSLADALNNRVGVGVVRGDSRRFGAKQYWVAVIYAAVPSR